MEIISKVAAVTSNEFHMHAYITLSKPDLSHACKYIDMGGYQRFPLPKHSHIISFRRSYRPQTLYLWPCSAEM